VSSSTGIGFGASAFYYSYKWFAKAHRPFYQCCIICRLFY